MEKLSDFRPLQKVTLPGLGDLSCAGLTLIVGPNSSGKSQFLQDLYARVAGQPRTLVVASEIEIRKPELKPFLHFLRVEGFVSEFEDEGGRKHIRPLTTFVGTGQPAAQISVKDAESWYGGFSPDREGFYRQKSEFLNYFGRLLVTGLFLERRLSSMNSTGLIDLLNQPPQHDLHALYLDDGARDLLHAEMRRSFDRAVWPDMTQGTSMSLKVSEQHDVPSAEDRLSAKKMANYRTIETEGDGMKSFVATCVALLLGRRPVCLIDEPEMCLHPPQAYNLGRFIGRYGASLETATFVATHSSHLLRGVLQNAPEVRIVRLTRNGGAFSAHLVPATELSEALSRPTLRAETVLDGIFSQAVVVVEADGDRSVYQAVWETLQEELRLDLHFAAVGGTGGIADTCVLYRALKIPVAVIADLDMLVDDERMTKVLEALVASESERHRLIDRCRVIGGAIQAMPPTISKEDVAAMLDKARRSSMDWSARDDVTLRRSLRDLTNDLDRMRRLKAGGINSYGPPLSDDIRTLVMELAQFGLFLVPVGELEQWLGSYSVGVPKSRKRAWSNAAAQLIQKTGKQGGDVWDFMRNVGRFLNGVPT